ncbi:hypothetical protein WN48_03111 [Eufriesea mexicana]|nr:hypothetical protein WN48_03111 [Eufriesea mexicana]
MKAKARARKPNGKFRKVKFPSKEITSIDPDLSQLHPPIDTSVSTLYRVSKVLENGSDEVRSILAYECDLISTSKLNISESEKHFEEPCGNDRILRSQVCKEQQKKDLTAVVNMLQKKQIENLQTNTGNLCLETVHPNSSAVYQTIESVMELKGISEQTAVLGLNGQILQSSQQINSNATTQIHNNGEIGIHENELICPICYAKFSTKKTLTVHTRTLHTSHRLCYPCPCCSSTFANTWSVYRHLFKVHRKSNEQVRRLRTQIQEKAFIKDTTAAEDLQREDANKTLMNSALRVNETQEWIDHLESDTELQRCGGCGKRFDRKAALSSHLQYCHRRVAAYENTTKIKKINKVPLNCISNDKINNSNETPIRVEAVASLSKADWDMLESGESVSQNESNRNVTKVLTNGVQENIEKDNLSSASDVFEPVEIVYTNINKNKTNVGSKKRKNKDSAKRLNNNTGHIAKEVSVGISTEHVTESEKLDHVLTMEKKVTSIVNFQKLECLPCKRKFTSVNNLRRHAAIHIGWNRYQCKLCDYKCFVKCDCIAHCNKIHNAQNNRPIIEEMIIQIPDDQYACDQNITSNMANLEEEIDAPEIVEVNISPEHMEPEVQVEEERINETETEVIDKDPVVIIENGEIQETLNNAAKGQNTLGLDPDLRRMVMEVIFGSSEVHSTKQADSMETVLPENSSSKSQNIEAVEARSKDSNLKESDTACMQDSSKSQRPIRNKIKPLNKDFIYDLKEVTFRKDSLIMKSFNKPLAKKSPVQEEDNLERDLEQPSKRFKPVQNDKISILCANNAISRCEIKLDKDLKNSFTFSQCHS